MQRQKLPHSQSSLILGIISIITSCCCWGLPGVVLGLIGMNEAKKAKALYDENPEMYDGMNNANTGRITSLIGLILGILIFIYTAYVIYQLGGIDGYMEKVNEMMEQYQ